MSDIIAIDATDPVALAMAVGGAMLGRDSASQTLGVAIIDIGPGYATLTMAVRPNMLNGHQTCHGGFLFALADSAFAFACNSRNEATVAAGCNIEYLRPVTVGSLLTATAVERSLAGRSGVYDVTVSNAEGVIVALFRGKSARVKGDVLNLSP